jgi:hypothetical protein
MPLSFQVISEEDMPLNIVKGCLEDIINISRYESP